MSGIRALTLVVLVAWLTAFSAHAAPRRSHAMHGNPALPDGFEHYNYVNPDAPKGGRITLGQQGTFVSLNPLIIKGPPATGVREFQVEALMTRGLDEPFTLYGLIAETIDVADDRRSVTFVINPKAAFSDRKPVTADDVIFSFELLKTKGRYNHRTYFAKVSGAEKLSDRSVRFNLQDANDRELPMILGVMPVFAKHATNPETFDQTSMTPLTGSGPYTISKVDPGRSISFTRDAGYWAKDLAVSRGRFNFEEIRFEYFRDGTALFEAFKTGLIDLRLEEDPANWASQYEFSAVKEGRVLKKEFDIALPAGMTALVFNTRRPRFQNPLVRQALIKLFDFEWMNRTLYFGLQKRTDSFFVRSYLSATGKEADARERELLSAFPNAVRPEILEGKYTLPKSDGSGQNRENQKAAFELLKQAGYKLEGGKLIDASSGQQFSFEVLAFNATQETLLSTFARTLEPLGIKAIVRIVDSAQYQDRLNSYDFDMIQTTWTSTLSPGNEQLFRWSAKNADVPGFNFAGVKNPAADAMIEAMLAAETKEEFVSAVRALDRVLLSGDYVIPMFHVPKQWVAHWTRLKHPAKTPVFGYAVDTWWIEETK